MVAYKIVIDCLVYWADLYLNIEVNAIEGKLWDGNRQTCALIGSEKAG